MDGTRFAIGLLILWLAFLGFFVALHPNGIANVTNPVEALKWLIDEFQGLAGVSAAPASSNAATPSQVNAATNAANAVTNPGFSGVGPQNVGSSPAEGGA